MRQRRSRSCRGCRSPGAGGFAFSRVPSSWPAPPSPTAAQGNRRIAGATLRVHLERRFDIAGIGFSVIEQLEARDRRQSRTAGQDMCMPTTSFETGCTPFEGCWRPIPRPGHWAGDAASSSRCRCVRSARTTLFIFIVSACTDATTWANCMPPRFAARGRGEPASSSAPDTRSAAAAPECVQAAATRAASHRAKRRAAIRLDMERVLAHSPLRTGGLRQAHRRSSPGSHWFSSRSGPRLELQGTMHVGPAGSQRLSPPSLQ